MGTSTGCVNASPRLLIAGGARPHLLVPLQAAWVSGRSIRNAHGRELPHRNALSALQKAVGAQLMRALVIEDNAPMANLNRHLLKLEGFQVDIVTPDAASLYIRRGTC